MKKVEVIKNYWSQLSVTTKLWCSGWKWFEIKTCLFRNRFKKKVTDCWNSMNFWFSSYYWVTGQIQKKTPYCRKSCFWTKCKCTGRRVQQLEKNNFREPVVEEYNSKDIFNIDETDLFFKCLPSKTLAFKDYKCFDEKHSKERVIFTLRCNMTGEEKSKPFIIGRSKKPRCFKGVKSL